MDLKQFLLTKLAEEAMEVAHIALKCQQFGIEDIKPGQIYTNESRLDGEFNDFMAIVAMLKTLKVDIKVKETHVTYKAEKVRRYLQISIDKGMVPESVMIEFDEKLGG